MRGLHFKFRIILPLPIIFFIILQPLFAGERNSIGTELDSLYRNGYYDVMEKLIISSLSESESYSLSEQAELHKYLGIVYFIKGRDSEGKQEFISWLSLEPRGYIDTFRFPPKIVEAYKEAKAKIETSPEIIPIQPKERWKPTFTNTAKSLLVPGWGQIEQGKTEKGIFIFFAQAFTVSGWLVSEHNFSIADKAYHTETELEEFDAKYDRANNWNKARWAFLVSSVAVYVFAQTDFILFPPDISLSTNFNRSGLEVNSETTLLTDFPQEVITITFNF